MGQYSHGVHVVYIPFKNAKEELAAVENWNTWNSMKGQFQGNVSWNESTTPYKHKRAFVTVTQNDPCIPPKHNFANSPQSVLYILGHCDSGSSTLSSSAGFMGISYESVTAEELANQVSKLIGYTAFAGGIKVYGCNSATDGVIAFSFAHEFAKKMLKTHNYNSCTIYGYTACISNYQSAYNKNVVGDISEMHKVATSIGAMIIGALTDFARERTLVPRAKDVRLVVAQQGKLTTGN